MHMVTDESELLKINNSMDIRNTAALTGAAVFYVMYALNM